MIVGVNHDIFIMNRKTVNMEMCERAGAKGTGTGRGMGMKEQFCRNAIELIVCYLYQFLAIILPVPFVIQV